MPADLPESSDPASMTERDAWAVLGVRGEKLEQYRGVLLDEDSDSSGDPGDASAPREREVFDPEGSQTWLDAPVDLAVLPEVSPELVRFAALAPTLSISNHRGELVAVAESTLDVAVATIDGNWLARIQSIFLPASVVSLDDESLILASWKAGGHGTSATFYIHQDDAAFTTYAASLSGMVVELLDLGDTDQTVTVSEQTQQAWTTATRLAGDAVALEPLFDVLALEPRTHWIVNLLVGKHPDILSEIHLGRDIATAATREDWSREEALLDWPHLQAYWLLHHAVFGDLDALARVVERADPRYPGVVDLLTAAKQLLAGEPVTPSFWNDDRVLEVRMAAQEERPDLLTEAALAQLAKDDEAGLAAAARKEAALETLRQDEDNERLVGFLEFLGGAAGSMEAYQEFLGREWKLDIDVILSMKKGRTTTFEQLFRNMETLPQRLEEKPSRSGPVHEVFEAALLRGADSPDDHKRTMAGTLYGLGLITIRDAAGFEAFLERVQGQPFYPDKFGPYRRLEVAMLAQKHLAESAVARDFLRAEAARYAAQSGGWSSDTFDFADRALTEAGDEQQLQALADRLARGGFSGANWKESVALAQRFLEAPSPVMASGLKVAVEQGLGRHDDGERAVVVRAYVRCAGPAARADLDHWLAHIDDVRTDCQRAALLAGYLELDVGSDRLAGTVEQALDVLGRLHGGSMKVGAGLSLLKTAHDRSVPGFRAAAVAMAEVAKNEKYGSDELKAWIQEAASTFPA